MAANDNPYLALLQQEEKPASWAQILQHIGNLGFGLAGGFGQAATTGQPTMAGVGPGLMMGNQMNAQAAQQAEKERMKRIELQFQAQQYEDKRIETLRKQKALEDFAKTGFQVTPQQAPLMGPTPTTGATTAPPPGGNYDTRVAAAEGGTKKGGMVFNELGSGAFGPYQFMPATYAGIRAKNPHLNLPEDMTKATREQWEQTHNVFKAENAQGLQAGGFQPTPDNLYLAHRFGVGGALSVLRADPNKPLSEVLPIDWQRQNPDMRGQTVGGFRRLATERVGGGPAAAVPYEVRPDAKPTQYSLMPDDVPFNLGSAGMTSPQPRTAMPSWTAPVMPQPTWETPGDVAPINPGALFQPPPPPQPPAAPVPGQPGQPGQPPPAPAVPGGPGGPNVVQAQAAPGPNTPPMTPGGAPGGAPAPGGVDAPPQRPVTPMPGPDPAFAAQQRAALVGGLIKPDEYVNNMRQHVMDRYNQADKAIDAQQATAMEVYRQQQESRRHERGLAEQKAAEERRIAAQIEGEKRKLETDLVPMRDRTTGEVKAVSKAEAVAGAKAGELIPLEASQEARAEAATALAKANAERAAEEAKAKRGDEQTKAVREDENKLRDDFDKSKVVAAYRVVVPMLESAKKAGPTRAGDLNLIYAFAKLMDPESVVRESETGMVTATGTFGDRLAGITSQLTGGQQLQADTRKNLIAELDSRFGALEGSYKAHEEAYRGIAERRGLDFNNIRIPIRPDKPAEEKPPPQGTFPAPPTAAIKALQMAPDKREDFDKLFGPGAAAKVLGR